VASDYTTDLIDGAALLLVQAALGVYRTDGTPYTAADTAVVVASMPDGPDRAICLTPYDVEDNDLSDAVTGLQIRMRTGTDPRS
jgi:hypothetical protein